MATHIIIVLIIVFSVIMIIVKARAKKQTTPEEPERHPDPFELAQISQRGMQMIESLQIIESTANIETLRSRIQFIMEKYSTMVVLAVFKHQYVSEAEKAMNNFRERYPNKIISQSQASLLLMPNMDTMKNHIANCIVVAYGRFVKKQVEEMEQLKRPSAINNRREGIIKTGYNCKYMFKTFDLPDHGKHLAAIEEIRKQFYAKK